MMVKEELNKIGLHFITVELGEVENHGKHWPRNVETNKSSFTTIRA
jgi:hypothetical protein